MYDKLKPITYQMPKIAVDGEQVLPTFAFDAKIMVR